MTLTGRLVKLEAKTNAGTPTGYFVASEAVAQKYGLPAQSYIVTDDPTDDPPHEIWGIFEDWLDGLDNDDEQHPTSA